MIDIGHTDDLERRLGRVRAYMISLPLEILVLTQSPLQAHAELLKHPRRTEVVGNTPRPDPVDAQLREPILHHRPGRFGGVSLSPKIRIKLVADIRFTRPG